jgi:hypothetical protein
MTITKPTETNVHHGQREIESPMSLSRDTIHTGHIAAAVDKMLRDGAAQSNAVVMEVASPHTCHVSFHFNPRYLQSQVPTWQLTASIGLPLRRQNTPLGPCMLELGDLLTLIISGRDRKSTMSAQ